MPNDRKNCPYRHENGNCLPVGGFCAAVSDEYCEEARKKNDFVSRQWLIDEYHRRHEGPPGGALKMIEEAPAADVEPVRHGYNVKWDYPTLFECSLCGWECFDTVPGDTDTYQYCPNCGAKMDTEPPKEEDDV